MTYSPEVTESGTANNSAGELPTEAQSEALQQEIYIENGIYRLTDGLFIGKISLIEAMSRPPEVAGYEKSPAGLSWFPLFLWSVRTECAYNAYTIFEMYIAATCAIWGGFLLLPFRTFAHTGGLWLPMQTLFNSPPGSAWYEYGAENMTGGILFLLGVCHLGAILFRRKGDMVRRLTLSCLVAQWAIFVLIFAAADLRVQNYMNCTIAVLFLLLSLRAAFRKGGK